MEQKNIQLELGSIVSAGYYSFQEIRKAQYNRIRNVVFRRDKGIDFRDLQDKKKKTDEEKEWLKEYKDKNLKAKIKGLAKNKKLSKEDYEYVEKLWEVLDDVEVKEKKYNKLIEEQVKKDIVWLEFGQYVKGLGTMGMSSLLYYFGHCEKARYPSSLWAFAGFTPDSKFVKGESAGFNKNCRMLMWRIADSFRKSNFFKDKKGNKLPDRYRKVYDTEKARQVKLLETEAKNAPSRLGHAESRAMRKMIKYFLVDFYRVSKHFTEQEQSKPYVIEKLGHEHFDDVLLWIDLQKAKQSHLG